MKKAISLLLALVLCLSLCACGKSEEAKNAELQIATLTADSTYQEIYDVYSSYMDVEYEDRQNGKVENEAELAKYCNLLNGHFVLNDAMIDSIEGAFEGYGDIGYSHAIYAIQHALSIKAITQGWTKHSDIEIASVKQGGNIHEKDSRTCPGCCAGYEHGSLRRHQGTQDLRFLV